MPATGPTQRLIAQIVAKNAAAAIDFYVRAFGAREEFRLVEPSGKLGHAELIVGGSRLMIADEYPDFGALAPPTFGGSPVRLLLYVDDVDAAMARALAAGATELRPIRNEFYGDRTGTVLDPFGYTWSLATTVERVTPAELQRRFTEMLNA
jgi:PhnB protein